MGWWEDLTRPISRAWDDFSGNTEQRRQEGMLQQAQSAADSGNTRLMELYNLLNSQQGEQLNLGLAEQLSLLENNRLDQSNSLRANQLQLSQLLGDNTAAMQNQTNQNTANEQGVLAANLARGNQQATDTMGRQQLQLGINAGNVNNQLLQNQTSLANQLGVNHAAENAQLLTNAGRVDARLLQNQGDIANQLGQNHTAENAQLQQNFLRERDQLGVNRQEQLGEIGRNTANQVGLAGQQMGFNQMLANQQLMADRNTENRNIGLAAQQQGINLAQSIGNSQGNLDAQIAAMHQQNRAAMPMQQAQFSALSQALPALQAVMGLNAVKLSDPTQVNPEAFRRDLAGEMTGNLGLANSVVGGTAGGGMGTGSGSGGGAPGMTAIPMQTQDVDLSRIFGFNNPAYQMQLEEGQRSLNNQMAARGRGDSSAAVSAQTDMQRRLTADEFNAQLGRLQSMANFGAGYSPLMHNAPQTAGLQNVNLSGMMGNAPRIMDYNQNVAAGYGNIANALGAGSANTSNVLNQTGSTALGQVGALGAGQLSNTQGYGAGMLANTQNTGQGMLTNTQNLGAGQLSNTQGYGAGMLTNTQNTGAGQLANVQNTGQGMLGAQTQYSTDLSNASNQYGTGLLSSTQAQGNALSQQLSGANQGQYDLLSTMLGAEFDLQGSSNDELGKLLSNYRTGRMNQQGLFAGQQAGVYGASDQSLQNYFQAMAGVPQGGLYQGVSNAVDLGGRIMGLVNPTSGGANTRQPQNTGGTKRQKGGY